MTKTPLFSILHTSARPNAWRAVYDDWMSKAVHPEQVEYVLVVDPRWGFSMNPTDYDPSLPSRVAAGCSKLSFDNLVVTQNTGRMCYVDGVNIAAQVSSGSVLIVNADDQFACERWDSELEIRYRSYSAFGCLNPFVIEVDWGGHEHDRGIMPAPILSRARYEQQGYVFYPEYESMWADNDFFAAAYQDGVVIDARRLLFPHKHPMYQQDWAGTLNDTRWDEAYKAQNRSEAAILGKRIFERRKASGFSPMQLPLAKRTIALCLPGEHFEGPYLDAILDLQAHILLHLPEFDVVKVRAYTTNPFITREDIRRALDKMDPKPELCLWIDDDNPVSVEHFDQLLAGLESHPEIDGVSAWCWIHRENKTGFMVSCGHWSPDHLHWDPFPPQFAHLRGLQPFETGGLPCILMRYSALVKAQAGALALGKSGAFLPIIDSRLEHGMSGEDLAFFLHAEKGGASFMVDASVRVDHLKYVSVEPVLPEEGKASVKVACMMRAKNEARWIGRVIESVKALCGEFIYVMEDRSWDDTRDVADRAGAFVLESPFIDDVFNEVRDKDWLLDFVTTACNPDWILMLDGDEELEPSGCEKIRRVLETNPPADCFTLRVLNLWDSVDTYRSDGVYGPMARQSLFRANSGLSFKSMYEGDGSNHCGLHCSNAPGLGGGEMRLKYLKVAILHYGNMHREDRIRKYRWILTVDPHNEGEGFYEHCVQGDLPEFPRDAVLKHGGPLVLTKLPSHLVPKFDVVPGPLELAEGVTV